MEEGEGPSESRTPKELRPIRVYVPDTPEHQIGRFADLASALRAVEFWVKREAKRLRREGEEPSWLPILAEDTATGAVKCFVEDHVNHWEDA